MAKDVTLPTFTANKEEVVGGSLRYKYASEIQWDDVKITFYHVFGSGSDTLSVLHGWRSAVWTPETGLGSPSKYKKTSIIGIYSPGWELLYNVQLIGSWPQTIKEGDLTYTSSDIKVVEVVISYDWAVMENKQSDRPITVRSQ